MCRCRPVVSARTRSRELRAGCDTLAGPGRVLRQPRNIAPASIEMTMDRAHARANKGGCGRHGSAVFRSHYGAVQGIEASDNCFTVELTVFKARTSFPKNFDALAKRHPSRQKKNPRKELFSNILIHALSRLVKTFHRHRLWRGTTIGGLNRSQISVPDYPRMRDKIVTRSCRYGSSDRRSQGAKAPTENRARSADCGGSETTPSGRTLRWRSSGCYISRC